MRDQLIQAGARAIAKGNGWYWDRVPDLHAGFRHRAEKALDAFLEVLDANDEAWMEAARHLHPGGYSDIPNMTAVHRLLSVLRGSDES